jgi:quinol monooxygenase YgiN
MSVAEEDLRMAEHANVIRVARFQPAPGRREELISRLQSVTETIRQMDGCFGAQICSVREAPDTVVAISRWASQSAVDQFLERSANDRAEVAQLAAAPPSTENFIAL